MFKKILIANRGEIACRIIRTIKKMGITACVVYSDIDKNSLAVLEADEAYPLNGHNSADTYLNIQKIIQVACKHHIEAIHPGYGFLSENATFARACQQANIIFIGPQADVIEIMGSKAKAKELMKKLKVPCILGFQDNHASESILLKEANKIGFPLLIKASFGGGGKGMRIVEKSADFLDALHACQREAEVSFGYKDIILEKYLSSPKHIEIQILADHHGNVVHLFERDCSIQRRYQKIIEEAPATRISKATRNKMAKLSVKAAKAMHYQNAGTLEFLVDEKENFYFLEMNTRLQVEHPVTEAITGLDLVELQILIASNAPLPFTQKDIQANGHAIEARVYAEDPENHFFPATGSIEKIVVPEEIDYRLDIAITKGDIIDIHYDPMMAKLTVHHDSRETAIQKLQTVLSGFQVFSLPTNLSFLRFLLSSHQFYNGQFSHTLIETQQNQLIEQKNQHFKLAFTFAALFYFIHEKHSNNHDIYSPWRAKNNWRLNHHQTIQITLLYKGKPYTLAFERKHSFFMLKIDGLNTKVQLIPHQADNWHLQINGQEYVLHAWHLDDAIMVFLHNITYCFHIPNHLIKQNNFQQENALSAPMPGIISKILVRKGETVHSKDALLILEAMKMEHTITAPYPGIIKQLNYNEGDTVNEGNPLIELSPVCIKDQK